MGFERVYPKKYLEKIIHQFKQQISVPRKRISLSADEFPETKEPCITFNGFKCFSFFPSFVSRDNEDDGWDAYVFGDMGFRNREGRIELIASFTKTEKYSYKLSKYYVLVGSDQAMCRLILSRFIQKYCRKYRVLIRGGMRDVTSYKRK